MKKAIYHQELPLPDVELFIVKENEDGTVDLANKDNVLIVTSCKLLGTGEVGTCSLSTEEAIEKVKSTKKP